MGQIVKRKKKGRPAAADPGARELTKPERDVRRSLRRRNVKYVFDLDDYFDEDEVFADDDDGDGDDHGRREKKLELLLKLQTGGERESTNIPQASRTRRVEHAPALSASSDDDKPPKKRRIDDEDMDTDIEERNYNDDDEEDEVRETKPESRGEDSLPGTPTEGPSPGLPMPDKRDLELILDKLQKKDIYGVYAEPVDPEELPDYHDVIKNPMDFATVRNKLGNGSYATFEKFESDVFLICSNAMLYNAPDTVYHKQARTIQELATRKFHKIRLNAERIEKEVKPEQKTRSTSILKKQIKRSLSRTLQEPVGSDFSSGATLATPGEIQNVPYALHQSVSEKPSSCNDGLVESNSFLNDSNIDKAEESTPGKGPTSRFVRKSFVYDENRRATYSTSLSQPVDTTESIFSTFDAETKELVPVGLYSDHSYARSMSRFAANIGSVAWKVASNRIEQALPEGFKFGQGWVGEYEPLPTPVLMLQNCTVKEPPYLAKVQQNPRKFEKKVPTTLVSANKESPCSSVPFLEQKLPFLGPTGIRPPPPLPPSSSPSIYQNIPETKPSFFLSPTIKPSTGAHNISYHHQNLQSRPFVESDKNVRNKVESNGQPFRNKVESNGQPFLNKNAVAANSTGNNRHISKVSETEASRPMEVSSKTRNFSPSGSFKQPDSNGVAFRELTDDKKVVGNTIARLSSDVAKPGQGQGLSDPVQMMRMLSEKGRNNNQQKQPNQIVPQVLPNDSNNAAITAARAWMSVGAGGGFVNSRPVAENTNLFNKNQIYADSPYNNNNNSTRDTQTQVSRFGVHVVHEQDNKNGGSQLLHAFVPRGSVNMMVGGNEAQFQNQQRMVLPQMATADLSRFQLHHHSHWRNISPQMHSRQKQESVLPPDLNIDFQSSGSPGRPNSGVMVDSQQPDLALQL